ncbi:hypothetical protein P879_11660 [Paragonimus westermani]|uniref:Uncharacterized protein n=1 Tax=Paragonimus westermani TaxID=34504 RepID=A0A8T0D5L8_9TREM|nr:hypothetical protein P879_11660 [Paragonimus westermani]
MNYDFDLLLHILMKEQTSSAACNREAKIKRYKERKDLEENLKRLAVYVEQPHVDDEIKRDYYSTLIRLWICLVKDELPTLKQEDQLLSLSSEQLQRKKEPVAKPMKPFIITRDAIQAAVFGAGYPSLPTMSLDELCTHQSPAWVLAHGEIAMRGQRECQINGHLEMAI